MCFVSYKKYPKSYFVPRFQKCISLGGDEDEVDEYRSAIFYHTNQPRWNENIRLSIPMEKFKDTHIRLECRHCSATRGDRNLFAMAFMRLMKEDGTTVEDSEHELFVYKVGEQININFLGCSFGFCKNSYSEMFF